jgi:hypothetical protein
MFPPVQLGNPVMEHSLTRHARKRAQQRGIRPIDIDFVIQHADVELEAPQNKSIAITLVDRVRVCSLSVSETIKARSNWQDNSFQ